MNVQILIDSVVRQVTVLIAQLATSGGVRAPVAHIANQVFVDLANELHAQGVSRKVSADMFGMALRAYIRKLRRLSEGSTEKGKTLWQAVLEFIRGQGVVGRPRILERFERDDDQQVSAILHDLIDSGLVFTSGAGQGLVYRAASDAELGAVSQFVSETGLDELVLALVYRAGPCNEEELILQLGHPVANLKTILERLVASGRLQLEQGRYSALDLVIPLGATVGWEAAMFDHLQAMVQTICQRLRGSKTTASERDIIGGSTYTYDIWPGHPLEHAVKGQLELLRHQCHTLRQKVEDYNREQGLRPEHVQVVTYLGQCLLERDLNATGEISNGDDSNV